MKRLQTPSCKFWGFQTQNKHQIETRSHLRPLSIMDRRHWCQPGRLKMAHIPYDWWLINGLLVSLSNSIATWTLAAHVRLVNRATNEAASTRQSRTHHAINAQLFHGESYEQFLVKDRLSPCSQDSLFLSRRSAFPAVNLVLCVQYGDWSRKDLGRKETEGSILLSFESRSELAESTERAYLDDQEIVVQLSLSLFLHTANAVVLRRVQSNPRMRHLTKPQKEREKQGKKLLWLGPPWSPCSPCGLVTTSNWSSSKIAKAASLFYVEEFVKTINHLRARWGGICLFRRDRLAKSKLSELFWYHGR